MAVTEVILAFIGGGLIASVGTWMAFGRTAASRAEVSRGEDINKSEHDKLLAAVVDLTRSAATQIEVDKREGSNSSEHKYFLDSLERISEREALHSKEFTDRMMTLQTRDTEQGILISQLRKEFERFQTRQDQIELGRQQGPTSKA